LFASSFLYLFFLFHYFFQIVFHYFYTFLLTDFHSLITDMFINFIIRPFFLLTCSFDCLLALSENYVITHEGSPTIPHPTFPPCFHNTHRIPMVLMHCSRCCYFSPTTPSSS
jgi:hypothetical protein